MATDVPAPLILWLHEGGWDEVIMVAVGLLIAYLVIVWTGRRSKDEDEDEDDLEEASDLDGTAAESPRQAGTDQRTVDRP